MLVINAHQPIEGPTAFYEAHLQSEEGWNILGGLFPGAPMIFHGVTPNLWSNRGYTKRRILFNAIASINGRRRITTVVCHEQGNKF
jgi:hypothetical protein